MEHHSADREAHIVREAEGRGPSFHRGALRPFADQQRRRLEAIVLLRRQRVEEHSVPFPRLERRDDCERRAISGAAEARHPFVD